MTTDQQTFLTEQARYEGERKGLSDGSRIERSRCAAIVHDAIAAGADLQTVAHAIETGAPITTNDVRTNPQAAVSQALQAGAGKSDRERLADEVDRLCGRSPAATDVINQALDGEQEAREGYPSARSDKATRVIDQALNLGSPDHVVQSARDPFPHLSADHKEKLADAIDRESPPAGDVVEARR